MKKSIWILNHYAVTPDLSGSTRHYDLGRELVKKGYRVTIFASGFDHYTKRYAKIRPDEDIKLEDYQGLQFVWLKTTAYYGNDKRRVFNMLSYVPMVLKAAKKVGKIEKPDVIIGSSLHPFAAFAGWWLAKKYKAKFVFEVRDLWPQTPIDMGWMKASSVSARLLYAWEGFMYRKAEKVIVVPPYAMSYIVEKHKIDPRKIVWIPNGVVLERFDQAEPLTPESDVVRAFQLHRDKFKVVYTGTHGLAHGLDVVVDAAAIIDRKLPKKIHIFLVGDGPEKAKLIRKAQELSLNNITFLNSVSKTQLPTLLQQADLLLHCLRPVAVFKYGISPNKIYDYLASGKPIIMSVEAANNIVEEAQAGFSVEPGNPEALAEGIIRFYQMPAEERKRLGENGRSYVEKNHSMEVLGEKLKSTIETVTEEKIPSVVENCADKVSG